LKATIWINRECEEFWINLENKSGWVNMVIEALLEEVKKEREIYAKDVQEEEN